MRTVTIDGDEWFVGKDVAGALGYENSRDALKKHVALEDKIMGSQNATPSILDDRGRVQYPTWINESGMYALIFGSRLSSAKRFKHWVTNEVLPAIRRTGSFGQANITEIIAQTAAVVCTELVKQLTPILQNMMVMTTQSCTVQPKPEIDEYSKSLCKLETFPAELGTQVDEMFKKMQEQQTLNFSMISRYCIMNGYSISQPSVRRYYQKYFLDRSYKD